MIAHRLALTTILVASFCTVSRQADAAGGTSIVATKGQTAHIAAGWPSGVANLLNDETRTTGWNSWFTEWPNDVNQYAFEFKSVEDLNRLVAKLAAVEGEARYLRLSYLKEPKGLGWVTQVPEGNGIPAIFSIGDQTRVDEWFKRVRKPFGVMDFTATPVAVPPTLTIFVQNDGVDLSKLKVPEGINISIGYVPTTFHKSNTTIEQQREKEAEESDPAAKSEALRKGLDAPSVAALTDIEKFIDSHPQPRHGKKQSQ